MFGIIRLQKNKRSASAGLQAHNRREKYCYSNPHIDHTRTPLNFPLFRERGRFADSIAGRLENVTTRRNIRKDAVTSCEVLVSATPAFFADKTAEHVRRYFEDALAFIRERYGADNVFSAEVHLDEKTPHLHVDFTPIFEGRLRGGDVITPRHLSDLHTQFAKVVGSRWGLERGKHKDEEVREYLPLLDYKIKTRKAELERIAEDISTASACKKGLASSVETLQHQHDTLVQNIQIAGQELQTIRTQIAGKRDELDRISEQTEAAAIRFKSALTSLEATEDALRFKHHKLAEVDALIRERNHILEAATREMESIAVEIAGAEARLEEYGIMIQDAEEQSEDNRQRPM